MQVQQQEMQLLQQYNQSLMQVRSVVFEASFLSAR